jgi:predicted RNA-binding Zn ribbon-like protein
MQLNPYGQDPVLLAVDLATDPPRTVADLADRCGRTGVVMDMPVRESDLVETLSFLDDWLAVVDAPDDRTRADLLNALLRDSAAYPRLTDHAGSGWHIHYRDPNLHLAGVLRALIAVGTALHLTGRGMHRLGRCARTDCRRVFADVSRNGRQRYCSPGCANRDAVRRHRTRSRSGWAARAGDGVDRGSMEG